MFVDSVENQKQLRAASQLFAHSEQTEQDNASSKTASVVG